MITMYHICCHCPSIISTQGGKCSLRVCRKGLKLSRLSWLFIFKQCNLSTNSGFKYGKQVWDRIEKFFTVPNYSLVNQSAPSARSLLMFSSTIMPNELSKVRWFYWSISKQRWINNQPKEAIRYQSQKGSANTTTSHHTCEIINNY